MSNQAHIDTPRQARGRKTLLAPRQGRSRETLNRILEAAEALMVERSFEKITVQQIVRKAKTTTGSFYARFKDKNALLETLHTQHVEDISKRLDIILANLPDLPVEDRVASIIDMASQVFRLRPALMRSGTLMFWNNPANSDEARMLNETHAKHGRQIKRLRSELETVAQTFGAKRAKVSANFALKIILESSRQHYLFSDERMVLQTEDSVFRSELTNMICAYLSQRS